MANVGVDLAMLESLLQVVVDCFVGDLAEQSQIGNADFLLLSDFEGGLLDVGLRIAAASASAKQRCLGCSRLALTSFRLTLAIRVSCHRRWVGCACLPWLKRGAEGSCGRGLREENNGDEMPVGARML